MTTEQAYIEGFVKRASEYGFNENEAVELLKSAAEDGPFRTQEAANMMASEAKLKALAHNRKKHPGHYYLNPFVGGPISEMLTRLGRRHHATMADEDGALLGVASGLSRLPLGAILGGDKRKDKARDIFNKHVADQDPE